MLTIEIKEDPDDPKERARRAAAKRKQKEAEANANNKAKLPVNIFLQRVDHGIFFNPQLILGLR